MRTGPSLPGRIGTPAFFAVSRATALSPIRRIDSGVGPMNVMPALADDLGEVGVLGEEAVAGMDGVGAGDLGGGDDARRC